MLKRSDTGSALQKAMAILEVIAGETHSIGIPDIAARLNLPRQTVHRMVRQMLEERLLNIDISRERYGIGPRTEELSADVLYSTFRRGPVHAILEELVQTIGETCNIGVLKRHEVIYLDRIETTKKLRVQMAEGDRIPAHASAIGKVLIANLPANGRRRFIASAPLARYTAATIIDAKPLAAEINSIRKQGFALSNAEYIEGLVAAAVPIIVEDGRVMAAISVNAPTARMTLKDIETHIPDIQSAVKKIQRIYALREVAG
jgi:IclR family transcriptional regulator, acetate operon repressor